MSRLISSCWWLAVPLSLVLTAIASSATIAETRTVDMDSCLSAGCHNDLAEQPVVHAPLNYSAACQVCHKMVNEGRHVFKFAAKGTRLCTQCHGNPLDKKYKHGAVIADECTLCHNPHQSRQPKLLKFPITSLCTRCHDEEEFLDRRAHGPVAEGKCSACHDAHSSDYPAQLKKPQNELCYDCHQHDLEDHDGNALPSLRTVLKDPQMRRHAPVAAGKCTACHKRHTSKHRRLLTGPYPRSGYAKFDTSRYMCFKCHKKEAFTTARSMTATQFRNGNLNLHYRHVNRLKGRSCMFCHDHHAARREKLIRHEAPFGDTHLNISVFEKTKTGGKCGSTCHMVAAYDRYQPAKNPTRVTPRAGADATAEQLSQARKRQLGQAAGRGGVQQEATE